jgi:maltodextrin utilization protein YvdJ
MKVHRNILLLVCVTVAFALPATAADVTGKWKAEFDTQVGVQKYTFEFKIEGEKLTGKASFERMEQKGEVDLVEGKVNGTEISFVEKLNFQGNELRIEYTGKINGDEISFTRKVGDVATEQFVAKRVKE